MRPYYLVLLATLYGACDSAYPEAQVQLVVESFVAPGNPLPTVRLRTTRPVDEPYALGDATAAIGAVVQVTMGSSWYAYTMRAPGVYEPVDTVQVPEYEALSLSVLWRDHQALASTHVPPAAALESVAVVTSDEPVSGLILDSLFIDAAQLDHILFDTLQTGASEGYLYLVEATMQWPMTYSYHGPDGTYWIRTQLSPRLPSLSGLDELFLRPGQLIDEKLVEATEAGSGTWTGIYAVPVEAADSPLPEHSLRVALVRGTQDYARFVSGSDSPKYREPPSNVQGALGIFAGVSVDSFSVVVQ